jgi:E3 ubiquitin-protein ligase UBR7
MYGDLDVLFLTDEYDTVLAYENKGKVDQATERRDPLMDTLSSMNRVQQVELICGKYRVCACVRARVRVCVRVSS